MRTIRLELALGGLVTPALLAGLSLSVGLDVAGWFVGLAAGWTATVLMASARARSEQPEVLPADWITLTRALIASGVAALVASSFGRPTPVSTLVSLASVALALDFVDGQVARRTRTATPLGATFDGEVDAFLLLVLSVQVSRDYGGWVLAIGAARYAFLAAGWVLPWLTAPLPPRYWSKVVTAVQGVVLTLAASGLVSRQVGMIAVAVALLLLAESFGRNVIWLYRTSASAGTRTMQRRTDKRSVGHSP